MVCCLFLGQERKAVLDVYKRQGYIDEAGKLTMYSTDETDIPLSLIHIFVTQAHADKRISGDT